MFMIYRICIHLQLECIRGCIRRSIYERHILL